jgi:hypothetical protein
MSSETKGIICKVIENAKEIFSFMESKIKHFGNFIKVEHKEYRVRYWITNVDEGIVKIYVSELENG